MQLNDLQQQVINNESNSLVIGGPGTGKTTLIFVKIKKLLAQGGTPESINIVCYSLKAANLFKKILLGYIGQDAKRIQYVTFKDLAEAELKAVGMLEGEFADNSQMRRLLHQAKSGSDFKGSIHEAEHIIRSFKSKAKKPQETEEHYSLFNQYQDLLHGRNWYDRYDCLRQHLISMRNGVCQPARAKYMFIDNAQDMNQIQLLWTLEHALAGIKIMLCVDDDQCIYERSGAVGSSVIDTLQESEVKFERFVLNKSYRLSKNLMEKAYSVVEFADRRFSKGDLEPLPYESAVEIKGYNSKVQEMEALVANIKNLFKHDANARVAVITRNDEDSRFVSKYFSKEGFPFADFSRSIWEMPGAIVVVDMLEILLGTAKNAVLKNVLSTFGLKSDTINRIFSKGLQAEQWLQNGAKIDKSLISSDSELKKIVEIQSVLNSYYKLRSQMSIKDIFKALCFELMKNMSLTDKKDALYAIEKVLLFRGDIKQNIQRVREDTDLSPTSQLIIGPVREFRNLEFSTVFMPFCNNHAYPYDYKVLGKKNSSDRRIFFTAMSRAKKTVYISYSNEPTSYIKKII